MAKVKYQLLRSDLENDSYIIQFLIYLKNERNYSQRTIETYKSKLNSFEYYFMNKDDSLRWTSISSNMIKDYIMDLMGSGLSASSVRLHLAALKSIFKFLKLRNKIQTNPALCIVGPKQKKSLPKFIREDDMNRLLDTNDFWKDNYDDLLAKTIILILYHTGIRMAELISMDEGTVDLYSYTIKVTGKGNKQRIIPFGEELYNAIIKYNSAKEQVKKDNIKAFILNKHGARITRYEVQQIVKKKLSLVTSQKAISPHVLRHTFATAMLNNEANLESIRLLMGHASIKVTQIYTHVAFNKLKESYSNAFKR